MKKLLLTAALAMVSLGLYAQGTVNFANNDTTPVRDTDGTAVTAADGIRVALYWAPTSNPGNFVQLGAPAIVGVPVAGVFSGGNRTTGPETPGGGTATFQVRAWELAYGTTYEAAIAAAPIGGRVSKRGISNTFSAATGDPSAVPPGAPGSLVSAGRLQSFTLDVPEPSVIALGVIGAGALLLLRRRK